MAVTGSSLADNENASRGDRTGNTGTFPIGANAPESAFDSGLIERGSDAVENSAIGALQSTAEGIIPFRGWVRKLTGAERRFGVLRCTKRRRS